MNAALEIWRALPEGSAWLIEAALRGAVLACATALVVTLLRRSTAALQHAAWSITAVAMLLMPVLTPWTPSTYTPIAIQHGSAALASVDTADAVSVVPNSANWVLWVYGAVALALLGRLLLGWAAAGRLVDRGRIIDSGHARDLFEQVRSQLGVGRSVRLIESDGLTLPVAAGLLRPTVALPRVWRSWSPAKLEAVVTHELAHISRWDMAPAWAAAVGRSIFWINPLAWYAEKRVRALAEQACDEAAVSAGCAPADYAQALVEIAGSASQSLRRLGWAAFAMARRPSVSTRVDRVLGMGPGGERSARHPWGKAAALIAPFALLAASLAPAQDGGGVQGIVLDPSGARVPRARVMLFGDSRIVATGVTTQSGEFKVKAEPGSYGIAVSAAGFALFSREQVVVTPQAGDNLEVKLRVESVQESLHVGPADPARPPKRIRVGGQVQRTRLLRHVRPSYPSEAKAEGVQGTAVFDAVIGLEGDLLSLTVRNPGADSRLIAAAIEALRQWHYRPTLLNGKPVEVATVIEVNFSLSR